MIYKSFQINIIIRVAVILLLSVGFAFVVMTQPMLFVPVVISVALVAAVINLIQYIGKTSRDLTHFLLSVRQGARTQSFSPSQRGKSFKELSNAFNEVIREFEKVTMEKELHYQYLQALNENINVAIISFEHDGKIIMMNPAARRLLFQVPVKTLEDFKLADPKLHEAITGIKGQQKKLIRAFLSRQYYHLGIQVKKIVLQSRPVTIVLLQNLNSELEDQETEAWHQLMRVLTHELMNSVTPIASLSNAMQKILVHENGMRKLQGDLTTDNLDDIYSSVETIASRAKSLMQFIHTYKNYARSIEAHLQMTDVRALIKRVEDLLHPDIENHRITLHVHVEGNDLNVMADAVLIEQAIINLIKNAMEAVTHDGGGRITISCFRDESDHINISVADNGKGLDQEMVDKIFIPFYTTKQKGSGIGLSLSRQIMRLHGGTIRVSSTPGNGSVFTIAW